MKTVSLRKQVLRGAIYAVVGIFTCGLLAYGCGVLKLRQMNHWPDPVVSMAGRSLETGLARDEVQQRMQCVPDHTCTYKQLRIDYYFRFRLKTEDTSHLASGAIEDVEEIPRVYSAFQCGFDKPDKLVVFGWIGEGGTAQTIHGSFPGSAIQYLPPEVLEALATGQPSPINTPYEPWASSR